MEKTYYEIITESPTLLRAIAESVAPLARKETSPPGTTFRSVPVEFFLPGIVIDPKVGHCRQKITTKGSKWIRRHLSWHLVFKGCSVREWYVLLRELEFQIGKADEEFIACLAGILFLSRRTRKSLRDWNSQLRPIHKTLLSLKAKGSPLVEETPLLDFVSQKLGIPRKGISKNRLYATFAYELLDRDVKPLDHNTIRDKGSMADTRSVIPVEEEYLPHLEYAMLSSLLSKFGFKG
jgi:hypothetical protein